MLANLLGKTVGALAVAISAALAPAQCDPAETAEFFGPAQDWYGADIAIEGDLAVVGAPDTTVGLHSSQGVVYIYRRVAGEWTFDTLLTPEDGEYLDMFGYQTKVANGRLIISRSGWDQQGAGGVFVFALSEDGQWVQEADIESPGEGIFGFEVAASGDAFCVGGGEYDSEAVYVYRRDVNGSWGQEARLTMPQGGWWDFGGSVAMSGDTIAVGSGDYYDYSNGRAYVFVRGPDGLWAVQAEIVPPPNDAGPCYYAYVRLSGDVLLVYANYGTMDNPYAASRNLEYVRGLHGWELVGDSPVQTLDNGLALSRQDGAVHVLRRSALGAWDDIAEFTAHDTVPGDYFGSWQSLRGEQAIIGAQHDDQTRAMYVFELPGCAPCPADLNGDDAVDFFDFLAFVNLFNANDPAADCNTDGEHDLFDFQCFSSAFNQGC